MRNLYVFGNELLSIDSFARKVARFLSDDFNIIPCRDPECILDADKSKEILILDVVKGLREPIVITDVKQLKTGKIVSLHDFDLGFLLDLLEGIDEKRKIRIIGVPQQGDPEETANKVRELA